MDHASKDKLSARVAKRAGLENPEVPTRKPREKLRNPALPLTIPLLT